MLLFNGKALRDEVADIEEQLLCSLSFYFYVLWLWRYYDLLQPADFLAPLPWRRSRECKMYYYYYDDDDITIMMVN